MTGSRAMMALQLPAAGLSIGPLEVASPEGSAVSEFSISSGGSPPIRDDGGDDDDGDGDAAMAMAMAMMMGWRWRWR